MNQLKKIQYNCRQATFLIEKRAQSKLSFREIIELQIHLLGCDVCVLYAKQSAMINATMSKLFNDAIAGKQDDKLHDSFKQEMQNKIEEELNKW